MITLKIGVALATIAIALGIIAGFLVITVDFTSIQSYLWIALIGAIVFGTIMSVIAFKKGKFPQSSQEF
jgi:hypothetical protein